MLLSLEETTLECHAALLGPSTLQAAIPQHSIKEILEEIEVCFPEAQGSKLASHCSHCLKDLKLYHFMVTAAHAALELHTLHPLLLVGENQARHTPRPVTGPSVT